MRKNNTIKFDQNFEQYEFVLENLGIIATVFDKSGKLILLNDLAANLLGQSKEALIGTDHRDFLNREFGELADKRFQDIISDEQSHEYEDLIEIPGNPRWFWSIHSPIKDKDGNLIGVQMLAHDISHRKKIEEALAKSEDMFRAIFESTSDCILVWDKDYNYLYANQSAIDYVGTTREKVIGKNIRDGLGHIPDFMKLWMGRIDKAFETGKPFHVEDAAPVGDKVVYSESAISPIRDADGKVFAVGVTYRDVSKRKEAEQAIQESEIRYKLLSDVAVEGIVIHEDGHIIDANQNFCDMFGYSLREIQSFNAFELVSVKDRGMAIEKTLENHVRPYEATGTRKDGTEFPIAIQTSSLTFSGRQLRVGSVRDITEETNAANELEEYREKMELSQRHVYINSMGSMVAHELNQPLTVINLLLGQIKSDVGKGNIDPARIVGEIDEALLEASNAAEIMSKFRQSLKKQPLISFRKISIDSIAGKIAQMLKTRAEHAGVTIEYEGLDELSSITFDENALEQIFFILIQNAIEASDGTGAKKLIVSGRTEGENILLSFSDNCGGVSTDIESQILEPFFTTKESTHGMGFGLEIIQRIMIMCRGKLDYINRPGVGLEFRITLPIQEQSKGGQ